MALEFLNDAYFAAKVGIGTESPVSIVDISSIAPILTIGGVAVNQFESGRIRFTEAAGTSAGFQGSYIHYDGSTNKLHLGMHEVADTSISNDVDAITILRANTYVGIGTDSPSYKLSVNGNIQSDFIRGYTYPTNSFLDFDDDQTASANHTRLASIGRIAYLADTNANEPVANAAHEFFTGTSDIDTATSLMIIETGGNVGIGTTSPNAKLEVNSAITFSTIDTFGQLVVKAASGSTGDMLNIGVDTANSVAFIQANDRGVGTIPLSLQRYGGNVGIGTTSPGAPLTLNGNGQSNNYSGVLRIFNTYSTGPWSHIALPDSLSSTSSSNNFYLIGRGNSYTDRVMSFHIPTDGDYGSGAQPKFGFYNSGAVLLHSIEAETGTSYFKGNVGIGTTSPNGILQFANNAETRKIVLYEGANNDYQFYGFGVETATLIYSTYTNTDDHVFVSGASSTTRNELMRIEGGGNVGIGTDSPASKLEVVGSITLRQSLTNTETNYISTNARGGGSSDADMRLGNSVNGDVLTIHNDKVGIRTSSPSAQLHVVGTGLFTGLVSGITPVAAAKLCN